MALETNQRGYDVISAENERISVKTVTSSSSVSFNANTFEFVDRVMVLRVNIDDEEGVSVETLLDSPAKEFAENAGGSSGILTFRTSSSPRTIMPLDGLQISSEATFEKYHVRQYENGTIKVLIDGDIQPVAKPLLRKIAARIGVDLLNGNGGTKNTRQLGAEIIKSLDARNST